MQSSVLRGVVLTWFAAASAFPQVRLISAEEAQVLEAQTAKNPDDLAARTQLLRYYFVNQRTIPADVRIKARTPHILWLIRTHPDADILGEPIAALDRTALRDETRNFAGEVVAVSGDSHYMRVDKPLTDQYPACISDQGDCKPFDAALDARGNTIINFTRLEVPGSKTCTGRCVTCVRTAATCLILSS